MKTDVFLAKVVWPQLASLRIPFAAIPRSAKFCDVELVLDQGQVRLADGSAPATFALLMTFAYDAEDQSQKRTRPCDMQLVVQGQAVDLPEAAVLLASFLVPPMRPGAMPVPVLLYEVPVVSLAV